MIILLKTSKTRCAWTVYRYFYSAIERAYSRCSKCPPFVRTHACRRFLHSLTAASTTLCADRSKRQPVAAWVCRHCGSASHTHAAAWSPKSCNQRGSGPDCWGGAPHTSGKMKSAVSRCRSSTVSRARCASALSCWKTKLSPATCLIAGNICCDEEHLGNVCRRLLPRVRRRKAQQRPFLTLRLTPDTEAVFCFFILL